VGKALSFPWCANPLEAFPSPKLRRQQNKMRVIGVGLPKTGTTSLTVACQKLGLRALHNTVLARREMERNDAQGIGLLEGRLANYEAFFDGPYAFYVDKLVEQYSAAKFIFHIRDLDTWLRSSTLHNRRKGKPPFRNRWKEKYRRLTPKVEAAMSKVDHLIIDVTKGEGWEKLCPFLGVPIPNQPFPHRNKGHS
jgi:hypothetical protein